MSAAQSYVYEARCGDSHIRGVNFVHVMLVQGSYDDICSVNFRAHDARTMLASTINQCGACPGSPNNRACGGIVGQ